MTGHVDTFVRDNLPPRDQWPELKFTLPELQFPAQYNASTMLDAAIANDHGARNAVLLSAATLSYDALLEQTCRIAHVLRQDFGLQPGNRVLIHASNSPLSLPVWWGVFRAAGVAVGTMPMLRAHELAVILNKAQITHAIVDTHRVAELVQAQHDAPSLKHIIATDQLDQRMAGAPAYGAAVATAADDPALIAFTSGTTGTPKGCVHFHRDIAAMAETFSRHILKPKPSDVFIGTPPFAFTFGLGAGMVFPAHVGAATAICERPGFDVLADTIAQHKATTLFTSPTGYRALMKQDLSKLASLHTCVSAGEHLPRATSDQWFERTGIRIIDGIGSTEMIHIFVSAGGGDIRPGATGKAVPGYEATLLDENDRPFDGEGEGRLAVKGPTGCRYLADERQKNYVVNGWNVTGDLYRRDADGYFWYLTRADDMIISSGYNIGAPEVENALLTHGAVAECAVVGAPDPERGQIVKAFVVLKPGAEASAQALQDHVKQTIAPYKYPRAIEFVAELPKTHTGKLQRFKLRETT
jgi:2-aminobenzoate-CoA ligase